MAIQPSVLRALASGWLADREKRGEISGDSAVTEAGRLSLFLRMYGDREPASLDRSALLEWQAAIGHLQPATRRAYVGTVGRFIRWMRDEGTLETDLSVHLGKVRQPRHKPRALRSDDVSRVIAACPQAQRRYRVAVWLRPATCLMVGSGLRCVEISNLDLDDYDPQARTLFVRGKGDHERMVPVPEEAALVVDEYLGIRGRSPGPLFKAVGSKADSSKRLSRKWVSKRTGRLMASAGVHCRARDGKTAHALRHTCATDAYRRSRDLPLVQGLLGHRSLATTEIYLEMADLASMRAALEGRAYLAAAGTEGLSMSEATALRGAGSRSVHTLLAPDPTEGPPSHHAILGP